MAIYITDENENVIPSEIFISSFQSEDSMTISMLGTSDELEWTRVGNGFKVIIPEKLSKNPPSKIAWVLKIKGINLN